MTNSKLDLSVFTAKRAKEAGISSMTLSRLVKSGELERMSRGIYESIDEYDDHLYLGQLRRPKIVYSHETGLYLHNLVDTNIYSFSVTVPAGYNTKALRNEGFKVFSLKTELYESDITQLSTIYGHLVNVYDLERSVVDVFRSRSRIDSEIVFEALKQYVRLQDRNLMKLARTAERFGVDKLLRHYLMVLL
jgi:predicted transcriptional regulator of viral defense system